MKEFKLARKFQNFSTPIGKCATHVTMLGKEVELFSEGLVKDNLGTKDDGTSLTKNFEVKVKKVDEKGG